MIKLENISKSYGSKVLLRDINYHLPEGEKIALVGNNGSGKTTLLKILLEQEEADGGSILKPSRLTLGSLSQEPNPTPKETIREEALEGASRIIEIKESLKKLEEQLTKDSRLELVEEYSSLESEFEKLGGYNIQAKADSILMGLGFTINQMNDSPLSLSGGWAMRLEMAKMLLSDPNFLILDEPTNHLDLPSLIWFENYLRTYKGTLLFVSHDRELLERLPNITLHLHKGDIRVYQGNYKNFEKQKIERELHDASQVVNLKKKKDELMSFVERFGAKATKAKQAKSKEKQAEKIQEEINSIESHKQASSKKMVLQLPPPPPSDRVVYKVEEGAIGYKEVLFEKIDLSLEKGQKIAIIGANGIGKSTLLKTIAKELEPLHGQFEPSRRNELAYFSQNLIDNLPARGNILDVVLGSANVSYKEARSLLGALLFTTDDLEKRIEVLSGGEKNRVALACVLAKKANFILLDEPTNHLDMESVEALVEAFKKYTGTVLFVSHNRFFINEISSHVLAMSKTKRVELFEGQLEDYTRLATVSGFPNVLEENSGEDKKDKKKEEEETLTKETLSYEDRKNITREINKLEKQIKKIDEEVHGISQKEEKLDKNLEELSAEGNHEELIKKGEELEKAREKKEKLEEEWLEASDRLEKLKEKL